MTAPDTSYTRILAVPKYLDDQNPSGTLFSPNPQKDPRQSPVPIYNGGQIVTYQATITPASVATITAAEKTMAITGLVTTDLIVAINKPTSQAGLNCHMARISATDTAQLVFSNVSGGTLTPTAGEVYNCTVIRGAITSTVALSPAAVPANGTNEQIFTVSPTDATLTLTVDGKGSIISAVVAAAGGGAGYYMNPTIIVTDAYGSGKGAKLRAEVSGGAVVYVKILDPGINYVSPTAKCVGGNVIAPGMFPFVVKPTTNVGVAIFNARISDKNQIALSFGNPTAAVVTPTASQNYTVFALSDVPATTNHVVYGVTPSLSGVTSFTSTEQSATVTGLLAADHVLGIEKPTLQAGLVPGGSRVSADNTLQIGLGNITAATVTPTGSQIYVVQVYKQTPVQPFKIFRSLLTPVAIAANTSVEQAAFTVTGVPAGSTIKCSKPSHQPGLMYGTERVVAADTIAITFDNTTAVPLTPTSEVWDIACFMAPGPGTGNYVALSFSQSLQRCVERVNDLSDYMAEKKFEYGA